MNSILNSSVFLRAVIIIAILGSTFQSYGQATRKYSNEFLAIGIGARALAMGNATVASVNNVTATFWNPAALAKIELDMQVAAMHSEYFAGIAKFDYAGIAIPLPREDKTKRFIGLSLIRFGVDDIPYTLTLIEPDGSINYDNVSSFSAADYAFYFSYAQDQPIGSMDRLKMGFNTKIVHRTAGNFASAWGFGLDLGAQLDKENWRFGLLAKDITTTFNAWSFNFTEEEKEIFQTTGNEVPENSLEITLPRIILGAAYIHALGERMSLLTEMNIDLTTDGKRNVLVAADPVSADPHLGLELAYEDFIFLRGGVNNLQKALDDDDGSKEKLSFQPNLGVGLRLGDFTIDYAMTDLGDQSQSLYSHIISLMLDFNKTKAAIRRNPR
jgi:hypothetical protein